MREESQLDLPLDQFGRANVTVFIKSIKGILKVNGLIDTGAFFNHITKETVEAIGIYNESERKTIHLPATTQLTETQSYLFEFFVEKIPICFTQEFSVLAIHDYDVIIGTQFLLSCKSFIYLGQEKKFELVI